MQDIFFSDDADADALSVDNDSATSDVCSLAEPILQVINSVPSSMQILCYTSYLIVHALTLAAMPKGMLILPGF